MLYREAGQFKSTYAQDQQIFPIRQDRIAMSAAARGRLRGRAADRRPVLARRADHAVPHLRARCARPEHPHRLRRTALARHRRVHGRGRVHGLQLRAAHAVARHHSELHPGGPVRRRGRHRFRTAQPAHQGLLPRGGDARLPVLRAVDAAARGLVHQQQHLGRGHGAADRDPRRARSTRRRASTSSRWRWSR